MQQVEENPGRPCQNVQGVRAGTGERLRTADADCPGTGGAGSWAEGSAGRSMVDMNKNMVSTAAGLAATAAAVGAAAYVMNAKSMKGQRKAIKKTAAKAGRMMSGMVSGVVDNMANHILG